MTLKYNVMNNIFENINIENPPKEKASNFFQESLKSILPEKNLDIDFFIKNNNNNVKIKDNLNFEKRFNDTSLSIDNGDGTHSTHKMISFEVDGRQLAAPTIIERDGELIELSQKEAVDYALKTKNYKEFKSNDEARKYASGGYKIGTKLEQKEPPIEEVDLNNINFNGVKEKSKFDIDTPKLRSEIIKESLNQKKVDEEYLKKIKSDYSIDKLDIVKGVEQKELINESNIKTKEDIIAVQNLLKDDYDLGNYGVNKDGVDGVLGKKTKQAINNYNNSNKNVLQFNPVISDNVPCTEDQCSAFVSNELYRISNSEEDIDDFLKTTGINGNAWNISDNILKNNGKLIYNAKDNIDRKNLGGPKVGDVVSMFTGGRSNYQDEANKKGDGNSHTGFISKVYSDGTYDVQHNVHLKDGDGYKGVKHISRTNNKGILQGRYAGFKVNKITRPDYESIKANKSDFNKDNIIVDNNNKGESSSMVSYFNDNKETLSKNLNLNEDELMTFAQAALGIIEKESETGESKTFLLGRKNYENAVELYKSLEANIKGKEYGKDIEASKSIARVKVKMNFNESQIDKIKTLIGNDDIDESSGAFLMTMMIMQNNYKRAKKFSKTNEEAIYRAISAHNSPGKAFNKKDSSFASNYDVDYANKVLLLSKKYSIYNKEEDKTKNTYIDSLLQNDKLLANTSKIKSVREKMIQL